MFIIDTKLTEDIFIEKLKEGINNQINKLEQEVVELVQEELEDLRENEEFDIDYYNKLEDFWNDYELYPLPAYHYGYYHTLAHEIEEKTNDFIYGLIIETIETIGIDKIRIFLMEQGYEADEVDKMDIQNLDWVLRQVLDLDDKIYEFADSIFYDFGEYEISFFTEDKISKLQELYEQIEKPDNFSSFNQHFENHLNIIKNQIKNLFKENYGELIIVDSIDIRQLSFTEEKARIVNTLFSDLSDFKLFQTIKYIDIQGGVLLKTRSQAIRHFIESKHWLIYDNKIENELFQWVSETVDEIKTHFQEWLKLVNWLNKSLQTNNLLNEIVMIIEKMKSYPSFVKNGDKRLRRKEEYNFILNQIENAYLKSVIEKYHCFNELPIEKKKSWMKTWFTDIKSVEKTFLQSKYFNNHLKTLSKQIFGKELSLTKETQNRKYIVHVGPTNSGKTHESLQALLKAKKGMYLSPLRLLALEKYEEIKSNGKKCALITGEERKNIHGSTHLSATVEAANFHENFDVVVIDECQMLSDHDRGSYWVKAILGVQAKEIHLITAPHALSLIKKILSFHGFGFEIVQHERNTPLLWEEKSCRFPTDIKNADALIVFSKRKVLNIAAILLKKGFTVSVLYGSMPPETRRKQMEQFRKGFSKILVSTDAIGMGLNLPIKRILFMENEKFDGKNVRLLKPEEVQQIAGRAGREGIYEKGLVNATKGSKSLKKSLKAIVQDIEFSYLPISQDSIKMFPYESFELLKRTWEFYQIEIKDSPYKVHPLNEVEAKMAYLERKLNNLDIELPLSKKVSLCSVPFSIDEQHMTQCWLEMIKEYLLGNELKYPHVYTDSNDVEKLENSYKKLSLYTSFLYSQSIDFDEDKVIDLKEEISKKIFQVLSKNLTTFIKKCTQCGKQLAWDFPHRNCEKCHRNRYYFEDYY